MIHWSLFRVKSWKNGYMYAVRLLIYFLSIAQYMVENDCHGGGYDSNQNVNHQKWWILLTSAEKLLERLGAWGLIIVA